MVVFEHVWSKDRVTGVASGDVEPEVAVFIKGSNLVWATSDGLCFLSEVVLRGSSLIHDEVSHLKCDVCVPALLCIFELFVSGHDQFVVVFLMASLEGF